MIILSEKFCALEFSGNFPEVVIHRLMNDEHYKFKLQRWQLVSSLQCPKRNSNEIISVCEQYRICPAKHTQLFHEDAKRWFPVKFARGNIKMLYYKSKIVFKFKRCNHEVFSIPHNTGIYTVGTLKTSLQVLLTKILRLAFLYNFIFTRTFLN